MIVHADTNVVIRLYDRRRRTITRAVWRLLSVAPPYLSPLISLELRYLQERGKLKVAPETLLEAFRSEFTSRTAEGGIDQVASTAEPLAWTRDLFDRMIVAHAMSAGAKLITSDENILEHFPDAVW